MKNIAINKKNNSLQKRILNSKKLNINELSKNNDIYLQLTTIRIEIAFFNYKLEESLNIEKKNKQTKKISIIKNYIDIISCSFEYLAFFHRTLIKYSNYIIQINLKRNENKRSKIDKKYVCSKKVNFEFYINEFIIYFLKIILNTGLLYIYKLDYNLGIKYINYGLKLVKEVKITLNPNIINIIIRILLIKQKILIMKNDLKKAIKYGKKILDYFIIEFSLRKNENFKYNDFKKLQNLICLNNINLINMSYCFEKTLKIKKSLECLLLAKELNISNNIRMNEIEKYVITKIKKLNIVVNNFVKEKINLSNIILELGRKKFFMFFGFNMENNKENKEINKNKDNNLNKFIILKEPKVQFEINKKRKKSFELKLEKEKKNLKEIINNNNNNKSINLKDYINEKNKYINNLNYNKNKFTGLGRIKNKKKLIIKKSFNPDIYSYTNEVKQRNELKKLDKKEPYEIDYFFKKKLENLNPSLKNIKNFNNFIKEINYINHIKIKDDIKYNNERSKIKFNKEDWLHKNNSTDDTLKLIGFSNNNSKKKYKSLNHLLKVNDMNFNKNFNNENNVIKIYNLKKVLDLQKKKRKNYNKKKSYKSMSFAKKTWNNFDTLKEVKKGQKLQNIIINNRASFNLENILFLKNKFKMGSREDIFNVNNFKKILSKIEQNKQFDYVKEQIQKEMEKLENRIWNSKNIKTYKDIIELEKNEKIKANKERDEILKDNDLVKGKRDLYKSLKDYSLLKIKEKKIWGLENIVYYQQKLKNKNIKIEENI